MAAAAAAAMAAAAAGAAAAPVPGPLSHEEPPEGDGEGAGAWREEKDASAPGAEALGDSEEDGEDVFEVEKILDVKTEGVRERRGVHQRPRAPGPATSVPALRPRGSPSPTPSPESPPPPPGPGRPAARRVAGGSPPRRGPGGQ